LDNFEPKSENQILRDICTKDAGHVELPNQKFIWYLIIPNSTLYQYFWLSSEL